ncbi:hypothetical protein [Gordonia aichiensis]
MQRRRGVLGGVAAAAEQQEEHAGGGEDEHQHRHGEHDPGPVAVAAAQRAGGLEHPGLVVFVVGGVRPRELDQFGVVLVVGARRGPGDPIRPAAGEFAAPRGQLGRRCGGRL